MSGGSFNYLHSQEPYDGEDLRAMASELEARGMHRAARETLALVPRKADSALEALWRAIEWNVSGDIGPTQVVLALAAFNDARSGA